MYRTLFISILIGSSLAGAQAVRPAPRAIVRALHGVPALFVDDAPYAPFAYMSYLGERRYYQEAADAGIHLYCFPAYLGDRGINSTSGIGPFRPGIWRGEGDFDFGSIRKDFAEILSADPEALVIIRFHLDPPTWWDKAHAEACCLLPNGTTFRQCFASPIWRQATQQALRHCLGWLLQSEYAPHLIGIHVAAGGTEEWFYHFRDNFHDRSPARTAAFRRWLRQAYPNDAGLQKKWHDPIVTLETAQPADISGARRSNTWRDPQREQSTIDTFRFHAQTMVDNISCFCRLVKDVSGGRLLTGAFYGYHYFVTDPRRGHGALHKLLDCPDLDYLSSPNAYYRMPGEDWPPMVAVNSVQLHGKLWMAENDTRTSATTLLKDRAPEICPPGQYARGVWLGPDDIETSVALLRKNTGRMLACGYGGWWFDMWGGWFSDPELLSVLRDTQELWRAYPSRIIPQMQAEVCVVVDEELCFRDASFGRQTEEILSNRYTLAKSGAPYDLYLRQDLAALDLQHYRVLWLLGIPELHQTESKRLRAAQMEGLPILWTDTQGTQIHWPNDDQRSIRGKFRWTGAELHDLWRQAGVHLYSDGDDVLYAGRGWLCLHSVAGGKRQIRLPFPAQILNPATQKVIHSSASTFVLDLPKNATTLLRVVPTSP
jgi:beta-galactosidase